jgi:lipoyl(octanoyl) transferase
MDYSEFTFSRSDWRLLITPPQAGPLNMAIDEAILEVVGQGDSLPTLRLYAWEPACISLGYAQPISDVDFDQLTHLDWDIVRRPTGGRAILHIDELTYAVITPHSEVRLAGSILESYSRISQALLMALHMLDIPARANHATPMNHNNYDNPNTQGDKKTIGPVCFEVPSAYEITAMHKKLIGNAQARRREGILQHGSLPLHGDLARITRVLKFNDHKSREEAAERLLHRATTVESVLGKRISWETAADSFTKAFQHVLNLTLIDLPLTGPEKTRADELVIQKYAHHSWTERI